MHVSVQGLCRAWGLGFRGTAKELCFTILCLLLIVVMSALVLRLLLPCVFIFLLIIVCMCPFFASCCCIWMSPFSSCSLIHLVVRSIACVRVWFLLLILVILQIIMIIPFLRPSSYVYYCRACFLLCGLHIIKLFFRV